MGYRYDEGGPTADLTVDTWGATLEEVFKQVAIATFSAMTPLDNVMKTYTKEFEVEGDDLGALLFNFVDELLYIHEVELVVFSEFKVEISQDRTTLKAVCYGEPFDLTRHEQGIAIKAVTFHNMSIEEKGGRWDLRVVLDT